MTWGTDALFGAHRLISKNITVAGRRTSMRLESRFWDALDEIARREHRTIHELCTTIDERRGRLSLTAAVRAAVVDYLWAALTSCEARRR
jgi:predicted DNA-binding ribbon-helix-helix protein